ncbi:hypothetical protein COW36_09710 [bacterium (Candidatus Blackallbacteria) CG17_big_fil_post_rev_8_21_14_2_50_48_46]|uniref:Uncharacterized protein n=1 Tax=bacterium (Candidatus Blackallbacteria) CG17_big_fil_post_rev_8_21_14_2_50_48_46 TaxID=2014261 RepID=A0A2M7G5M6_9BACT|nr:MAG: hypothetical protein COW64_01700 [bacterium (Candidatus Blackallbacteria) CG18_big_fil_WC_8_21_14_2_50_49_26]PIW17236.1 MAG: hypothetical protein COW36_09710 [bacterium (Candidatus Blackallbacteria) CG17_big_fil_post_rev_8_21_14_2_50_48_46]PIW51028.1 MAG: hypothetical protein COW20_00720 [bacterium (Candidatus Blackallbacteria) CG13_big_fil_rev_8_21_14_2_50_49_14]
MGNIATNYTELTRLHRSGELLKPTVSEKKLSETDLKALQEAKATTTKVLSSGIAGDDAKSATSTVAKIEQISRLSQGDVNAVNLKAAVDIGEQLTRGQVQQVLGNVSAPLGAIASVETFSNSLDQSLKNPNPQNLKTLMNSTKGATSSVGQISKLLVEHTGEAGRLLARGSQTLGKVSSVLNVGIAAMDLAIAGQDIHHFWQDPNLKSFTKMGLGMVAASASVISAAKVPGIGGKAMLVAALADAGKMSLDVDWGTVTKSVGTAVVDFSTQQAQKMKQDLLESRLPSSGDPHFKRMVVLSPLN